MKGIAISTIAALILMVVALIILWAFFQPLIQKNVPDYIAKISQKIYQNTFCKIPGLGFEILRATPWLSGC